MLELKIILVIINKTIIKNEQTLLLLRYVRKISLHKNNKSCYKSPSKFSFNFI